MNMRVAWQVLRLPILLGLIAVTGGAQQDLTRAVTRVQIDEGVAPWFTLIGIGLVFLVVMLLGRRKDPSRVVLAIEFVIAAVIALVPAVYWIEGLGLGAVPTALGATTANMFVPTLALAWMVVAAQRFVGAVRDHAAEARKARAAQAEAAQAQPPYQPGPPPPGSAEDATSPSPEEGSGESAGDSDGGGQRE